VIKPKNIVFDIYKCKTLGVFVILLLVFSFQSCKNNKEVQPQKSIYAQRKAFKEVFHQANSEKMIGHYERAEALFQQCLAIESDNHAVHFALSDLYQKQGDAAKTLSYAERAYELNSTNKWYILHLADLYFAREEFQKTADLYKQIIADEKNIDLKFRYTEALIRSSNYNDAIAMLNEIEVETGKIPEVTFTKTDLYRQLEQPENIEAELDAFLAENETNSDYSIMVAEYYMQNQEYAKSTQMVEKIIKNDPDYGSAYIMMADLRLRQDDVSGAFLNLEKGFSKKDVSIERKLELLVGLIPYSASNQRDSEEMSKGIANLFLKTYDINLKNAELHDAYAYFFLTQDQLTQAEEQYQIACNLNGTSFNSWLRLLNIQYELEHYSPLFTNGQQAAELFPSQPLVYLFTGIGAKETSQYDAAEEWLFLGKDLVVKDPELTSEFLYHLADLSYKTGDEAQGENYFEQALTQHPNNLNVYVYRAERFLEDDELDLAETEIKKGLNLSPGSPYLLKTYGNILMEKKEYNAASAAFKKALTENYQNAEILELYGDALFLSGKKHDAVLAWEDAIKYGSKSETLQRKYHDQTYYPTPQ